MWSPKSVNIFPLLRNTKQNLWSPDGKFWSTIFLLRIRTKRARLGPQWRFLSRIRLNTQRRWLIIQLPQKNRDDQIESRNIRSSVRLPNVKVDFIPFRVSTFWRGNIPYWKTAVWFFTLYSKRSFLSRSVKNNDWSPRCSHQATTVQHFSFQSALNLWF